ncbi:hypothetical protein BKA70DRAFT_1535569 [Coprinopsis sp. MPI-PUGE-AT-0042]|nr:hypothetical protein BKA70DRAFT_1535569 [Coprinopsis sp. MPI-PUGE-AT-0042]
MHGCLYIPEILENIFSFYEGYWKCRTLAKLARTCRAFKEPAIRLLWRHLPGFEPIVKLLPSHVLILNPQRRFYTLDEGFSYLRREDPFRRIRHYSRFIRRLDWTWGGMYTGDPVNWIHHSVFRKLYEATNCPRPFFPNLQEVQLPYSTSDPLTAAFYPSLVLSPSVRAVEILGVCCVHVDLDRTYHDTTDGRWRALAGRLFTAAPTLTRFAVTGCEYEYFSLIGKNLALEQIAPQFSFAMSDLELSALILDGKGLMSLGSGHLTGLVHLSISVAHQQTAELASNTPLALSFPALQNLSIKVFSFSACCAVVKLLDAKRLKILGLEAYMDSDEEGERTDSDYDPQPLFQALLNAGVHTSLERLVLKKSWVEPEFVELWTTHIDEQRFTIGPGSLMPLQPFAKLTSLTIDPCDSSMLADEALIRAFGSWPGIEECVLHDESFSSAPPALTVCGVHRGLQQTPSMRTLTLRFNGEALPRGDPLRPVVPHPRLETIDVASSTLSITSSGEDFGMWLQGYYPKVSKVKSFTCFRGAIDEVFEDGNPGEGSIAAHQFRPFFDLTTMVDRWNAVAYTIRNDD